MSRTHQNTVEPESVDMDSKKIERVIKRFRKQQANNRFPGGQLVVRRKGKLVIDLAIGLARGHRDNEPEKVVVTPETNFPVYSTGKPLAALAIALLEERGQLDIRAPIAELIPEFAKHGKDTVTTLDLLTHRAGIIVPDLTTTHKKESHEFALDKIVSAKPLLKRGTFAYMPFEFGTLLCEITRRLSGKCLADYFTDEFAIPLGLDSLRYGLAGRDPSQIAYCYWFGKPSTKHMGERIPANFEALNNEAPLSGSLNPAFSMITNAHSLAALYDFLLSGGVTPSGQRLLSEKIVRQYTAEPIIGWNINIHNFTSMGRGFHTGGKIVISAFGLSNTLGCFGHGGAYCSIAYGDHRHELSIAIVTNGYRGIIDYLKRFTPINRALRKACIK